MIEISVDFWYAIATFAAFGGLAFLVAFMWELRSLRKQREANGDIVWFHDLPPSRRQQVMTRCLMRGANWFLEGLVISIGSCVSLYTAGQLAFYFSFEGLLITAGLITLPVVGKETWSGIEWFAKFLWTVIHKEKDPNAPEEPTPPAPASKEDPKMQEKIAKAEAELEALKEAKTDVDTEINKIPE